MYKPLAIGGLLLILIGAIFGGIYASFFLPQAKIEQGQSLTNAFEIVTESFSGAKHEVDAYSQNLLNGARISNVHSHTILIGMLAVLFSVLTHFITISKLRLFVGAFSLLISGILLPVGIILENWNVHIGGYTAMVGGLLFIISIFIFLISVITRQTSGEYKRS